MIRKGYTLILSILAVIGINACYYDVEEELYPVSCDTSSVSYSSDILPVLVSSCYGCHSGATPVGGSSFDTYESFAQVVSSPSAQFFCRIKYEASCNPMPQGATKLSDCTILKMEAWVSQGSANN